METNNDSLVDEHLNFEKEEIEEEEEYHWEEEEIKIEESKHQFVYNIVEITNRPLSEEQVDRIINFLDEIEYKK